MVRPAILVVNGRGPKPLPGETVSTTTTVCRRLPKIAEGAQLGVELGVDLDLPGLLAAVDAGQAGARRFDPQRECAAAVGLGREEVPQLAGVGREVVERLRRLGDPSEPGAPGDPGGRSARRTVVVFA